MTRSATSKTQACPAPAAPFPIEPRRIDTRDPRGKRLGEFVDVAFRQAQRLRRIAVCLAM